MLIISPSPTSLPVNADLAADTDLAVDASPTPPAGPPARDPLALTLLNARASTTRRAYKSALKSHFGGEPQREDVLRFLSQSKMELIFLLADYRAAMRTGGASTATINLRLSALRALIDAGHTLQLCVTDARGLVKSEKSETYRDTAGTDLDNIKRLLDAPDRTKLKGVRDYAMLRVLFTTAVRRAGLCSLDVDHYDPQGQRIAILQKGKTERKWKPLPPATCAAISAYLAAAGHEDGALFRNCAFRQSAKGGRLSPDGLYQLVRDYGAKVGLKNFAPHKVRHSAITIYLDKSDGNLVEAQGLSGHADIRTLGIYDDHRHKRGSKAARLLSDLLDG